MKPTDGQHRMNREDHTTWCQNLFASLTEGGRWGIPRSGLVFTKREGKLILVERSPGFPAEAQDRDFAETKKHFELAGIEVEELQ